MKLQNDFIRPRNFLSNTTKVTSQYVPKLPPSRRTGRNYEIIRTNFLASDVKARNVVDFGLLEQQREQEDGVKISLGESTLQKLFQVQVDDPTDNAWIAEKNRRLRAGETEAQIKANPPFGRPQRKVMKKLNFGAQGLDINDKIELSKNAILQGVNLNRAQLAGITVNLVQVLGDVQQLRNMSQAGLTNLQQTLNQLNLPKTWQQAGFTHRFFTLEQYVKQAGLINLFLLSNVEGFRTLDMPVIEWPLGTDILSPKNIANGKRVPIIDIALGLRVLLGNPIRWGMILDLETKGIYRVEDAMNAVNNRAIDGGKLNGQDPPSGKWDLNKQPFWDWYFPSEDKVLIVRNIKATDLQGSPRMDVNFDDWVQTPEGQAVMGAQKPFPPPPLPLPPPIRKPSTPSTPPAPPAP